MSGKSETDTGWLRNLTYDAPQYVVLGGRRQDASEVANDLTALFLERIVPRFENPVVVLRYTSDLPEEIWLIACDKIRANSSFMVYNDENIIPAMVHCGIEEVDAVTYTMHGCNWPDIPGIQRQIEGYQALLPTYFSTRSPALTTMYQALTTCTIALRYRSGRKSKRRVIAFGLVARNGMKRHRACCGPMTASSMARLAVPVPGHLVV